MTSIGFMRSECDTCLYGHFGKPDVVYILLYVDDMLLISKSKDLIKKLRVN